MLVFRAAVDALILTIVTLGSSCFAAYCYRGEALVCTNFAGNPSQTIGLYVVTFIAFLALSIYAREKQNKKPK